MCFASTFSRIGLTPLTALPSHNACLQTPVSSQALRRAFAVPTALSCEGLQKKQDRINK